MPCTLAVCPIQATNPSSTSSPPQAEQAVRATFAHSAQYIALAFVLQPTKGVYCDSMAAVQRLLPLPYLRSGAMQRACIHEHRAEFPGESIVQFHGAAYHTPQLFNSATPPPD